MSERSRGGKTDPFEEQRRMYDLLSQETRHLILQNILGHPEHLVSLDELDYMIPKSKGAIGDQLDNLIEAGILAEYYSESNDGKRDLPTQFYGCTEYGVGILDEYNYLQGLPVARALYDNTRKSDKIRRHENASRPDLPETVRTALSLSSEEPRSDYEQLVEYIRERNSELLSVSSQIDLAIELADAGIGPDHEGLKRSELTEEFDFDFEFDLRTSLGHLEEVGIVQRRSPPGPSVLAISERSDEIVNGDVEEAAKRNIESLIAHIEDEIHSVDTEQFSERTAIAVTDGAGRTVRSVLAEAFEIKPESVESHLRDGDPVEKLNAAIEAIEGSNHANTRDGYGKIVFVRPAYRYRLTEKGMRLASE